MAMLRGCVWWRRRHVEGVVCSVGCVECRESNNRGNDLLLHHGHLHITCVRHDYCCVLRKGLPCTDVNVGRSPERAIEGVRARNHADTSVYVCENCVSYHRCRNTRGRGWDESAWSYFVQWHIMKQLQAILATSDHPTPPYHGEAWEVLNPPSEK